MKDLNTTNLQYKTLPAKTPTPKSIVIWLHGLGASADDFMPLAQMANRPDITFIFPQAPEIPVTINGGMIMPAWYDIYGIGPDKPEDEIGITKSVLQISLLVADLKQENPGIPVKLIGFSQGGAIALYASTTQPKLCTATLGLSTYLPLAAQLITKHTATDHTKNPNSINLMHGNNDQVIPLEYAQLSKTALDKIGYQTTLKTYNMGHEVCPEQIKDILSWL